MASKDVSGKGGSACRAAQGVVGPEADAGDEAEVVGDASADRTVVIPVGGGALQQMMRITKLESGELKEEVFDDFSFVPMLGGKNE